MLRRVFPSLELTCALPLFFGQHAAAFFSSRLTTRLTSLMSAAHNQPTVRNRVTFRSVLGSGFRSLDKMTDKLRGCLQKHHINHWRLQSFRPLLSRTHPCDVGLSWLSWVLSTRFSIHPCRVLRGVLATLRRRMSHLFLLSVPPSTDVLTKTR